MQKGKKLSGDLTAKQLKTNTGKAVKKVVAESSEESSEEVPIVNKKTVKQAQKAVVKKVAESSEEESDTPVVKAVAKKPVVAVKGKAPVKKAESSDDDSSMEIEAPKGKAPVKKASTEIKKPVVAVKGKAPVKKAESSDDDSSSEEVVVAKGKAPVKKASTEVKKPAVATKKPVAKESESEDDSEEEIVVKKPVKKASVEIKKPAVAEKQQTPAQTNNNNGGEKTLYEVIVKGLSFDADENAVGEVFEKYGEVDSINLLKNFDGRSKGIAFVRFTTEEAQLASVAGANGSEHLGRQIWVEAAALRGKKPERGPFQQGTVSDDSTTIFVGNLSFRTDENALHNFFSQCGTVVSTRVAKGEDQRSRGFGHVEFAGKDEVEAAMKLAGADLDGRPIKVDVAAPRKPREGGFGGDRGGRGGFGGGRGGGFGGGRGRGGPTPGGRGGVFLSEADKAAKKGSIVAFQGERKKL